MRKKRATLALLLGIVIVIGASGGVSAQQEWEPCLLTQSQIDRYGIDDSTVRSGDSLRQIDWNPHAGHDGLNREGGKNNAEDKIITERDATHDPNDKIQNKHAGLMYHNVQSVDWGDGTPYVTKADVIGESGIAETFRLMLTVLSAIGPLFGSLFFVLMSVAAAASKENQAEYANARRQALIFGFSVPIAIRFLDVLTNRLTEPELGCFFP